MPLNKHYLYIVAIIASLLCIYMLLPYQFSTIDGYSYAISVQHAENLFAPHHLLYSASNYVIYQLFNFFGFSVNVLFMMKTINAFAAIAALIVLALILEKLLPLAQTNLWWILLAGIAFGTLRFATDVETYIMPTVFSLLGSYKLIQNKEKLNNIAILLASSFAAVACLFHQIHFFWWLALAYYVWSGRKNFGSLLLYFIPALIVPVVYSCVLIYYNHTPFSISAFFQFVFHDYLNGQADVNVGLKGILLTIINSARTLFQIHGYIGGLFRVFPVLCSLAALTSAGALIMAMRWIVNARFSTTNTAFRNTHLFLIIMQFAFAALSDGNAEFMAVIVFQLPLVLAFSITNYAKTLRYVVIATFIWNVSMAAIPMRFVDMDGDKQLVDFVHGQKSALFILKNRPKADNMLCYYYNDKQIVEKTIKQTDNDSLRLALSTRIDSFLTAQHSVYTDALDQTTLSRESILEDIDSKFFTKWNAIPFDTLYFGTGKRIIYSLEKK